MITRIASFIALGLVASCIANSIAFADEPAAASSGADSKGLKIDVGKFTPYARGIVIEVAANQDGKPVVQVQVGKEATRGTGINVEVGRDAEGKPKVNVNVERDGKTDVSVNAGEKATDAKQDGAKKESPVPAMENYLGVFTRPIPDELSAQLGPLVGKNRGLLVFTVLPNSTAAAGGLQKHDIILRYNGQDVSSVLQIKKLIAADKPGATAKLEIVRGGEAKTLEVQLAQRPIGTHVFKHVESRRESRSNDEHEESIFIQREGARPIIINKHLIQVPGVTIQLGGATSHGSDAKEAESNSAGSRDRGVKQDSNRKLLVTTQDGKRFKVEIEYVAKDGAKIQRTFEGTAAEVEEKTKDLPQDIRDDVRSAVKDFDDAGDKKQSRALRFQIEPRVEGDTFVMRLSMRRTGDAGETRMLQLQQPFNGSKPFDVASLMKIDVIASELQALGPAIREKVEATLSRVEIPQVEVDVEKAQ